MGNAKSRNNNLHKIEKGISRNLTHPQFTKTTTLTTSEKDNQAISGTTTTTTNTVGGPLLVEVQNKKTTTAATKIKFNKAIKDPQRHQRQQKAADNSVNIAPAEQQQHQQQQRLKQASLWSLGSLNWNLSFSGRNSYKQRQKSYRKSFSTLQYQRNKRSKTQWHKPLTNAIFSSHFKESSRNEEFHIDHLVAKGAFGVVFKVIDKKYIKEQQQHNNSTQLITNNLSSPPVYALKVLKKSKIISENSLQQIKDEADIQKLCGHHPFIVQQFDLWQNRHNLHILSEYLPNGELFSTIKSFSLKLIRLYLAEIALALDFLHNAGIIYRDAKPENILLTSNYHLKLTDFGLSKWLKFGLTTKTICGTFQYMAPEILRGEPYTHAVDWWSLGIIICQMFITKSPDIRQFITINLPKHLQAKDSVDNVANLVTHEIVDQSTNYHKESKLKDLANFLPAEVYSLPHEAKDVLQRLLEFDVQKRIRSVRSLQRIAMYKDFKIESKHCLQISPLDIITEDNISLYNDQQSIDNYLNADKAFRDF